MGEQLKAFWLGIFIVGTVAVAAWLVLFLKPSVGDGKETLRVRFTNIDSVSIGTRVTFAGKPVGEVKSIQLIVDPRQNPPDASGDIYVYELILKVDSSVQVYSYDEIIYSSSGLLGKKSIAIIPKVPPPDAPPAQNITHDILYARSSDRLQQTLNQLSQVAEAFEETMEGLNEFFETNTDDFNIALQSVTCAANELGTFAANANSANFIERAGQAADWLNTSLTTADALMRDIQERNFIERVGRSFDNIHHVTGQISSGKGTLGQLINDNTLHLQVRALMCKFERLLNDINNYGLLFQYNKKWQRLREVRRKQQQCCSSEESFQDLYVKVESLQSSIKRYTEMLKDEYCR